MDFEQVEHGVVNIEGEGNAPMEEDDPKVENIIKEVGIGTTNNVPESRIEEDITGATNEDDEEDDRHTYNDDK